MNRRTNGNLTCTSCLKRSIALIILFLFSISTDVPRASASGYAVFTQSSSSLGQAAAVVSHTDSPSTIFFNPALMNKLEGTQVEIGTTLLFPTREFKSDATGKSCETKDDVFYPSTLYLTHRFNATVSAGIGLFNPFGLGTDWGGTWEGRYIATNSEMKTYNINPALSFRLAPRLFLAAGLDILFLDATLKSKINSGMGFDIGQTFKGDGRGLGYNAGLLYDVTDHISLGVAYRSEIKVNVEGRGKFEPQIPTFLENSSGEADITLPQQVFAGISYKGLDRLILEMGLRWEDWSCFRQLKVKFDNGLQAVPQPRRWNDTFAYNLGAEYRYSDIVTLRTGYLYGKNPVPDSTFDPSIPDSDTHLFTIGGGLNLGNCTVDLAYAYQMQEDRKKKNTIGGGSANGKYTTDIHILAASIQYRF